MSLKDTNYIPTVDYVVAIHGSPKWYSYTQRLPETLAKFTTFSGDGGSIVGGLNTVPQVTQTIDPMGGICDLAAIQLEIIDNREEYHLPTFFRAGSSGLDVRYISQTFERDQTRLYLDSVSGISVNDYLFLPRETVKVTAVGSNYVDVDRSRFSAFGSDRWPEYFRVVEEVSQGAAVVVSSDSNGGHYKHNERWVCIYRLVSTPAGDVGSPSLIWAGVIEEVHQRAGAWSLAMQSVTSLLEKKLGLPMWSTMVKEGYWLSGDSDDKYCLRGTYNGGDYEVVRVAGDVTGPDCVAALQGTRQPYGTNLRWNIYPSTNVTGANLGAEDLRLTLNSDFAAPLKIQSTPIEGNGGRLWFTPPTTAASKTAILPGGKFQVDPINRPPGLVNDGGYWWHISSLDMEEDAYIRTRYDSSADAFECLAWYTKDLEPLNKGWAHGDTIFAEIVWVGYNLELFESLARWLCSTGEGVNGDYDDFSQQAGLAIPEALVNTASFQALSDAQPLRGDISLIEAKGFKELVTDDLKALGCLIRWHNGQLEAMNDIVPTLANVVSTLDSGNSITKDPETAKGYLAPLEGIALTYNEEKNRYVWNMQDGSSPAKTGNVLDLTSTFLKELPDEIHATQWSRLLWLSQDTQKALIDASRAVWETIEAGDTIKVTHPMIQDFDSPGYGCTEVLATVISKGMGESSPIEVLFRTTIDPGAQVLYAPAFEVDLITSGTITRGHDGTNNKIYLRNAFSPELTEDPDWWLEFGMEEEQDVYWWDTEGNQGILDSTVILNEGTPYLTFSGSDPGWKVTGAFRVFLTVEDY